MKEGVQSSMLQEMTRPLLELVESYGISGHQFFEPPATETRNGKVAPNAFSHANPWIVLLTRAVEVTEDPTVALRYGQYVQFTDLGPLGFALMNSPDVRSLLRLLVRYHPIISLDLHWELIENDSETVLRVCMTSGKPTTRILFIESVFSSIKRLGDFVVRGGLPTLVLRLDYPAPKHASTYTSLLDASVEFNAPFCELVLPSEVLLEPVSSADAKGQVLMTHKCELILEHLTTGGKLSIRVRWLLVQLCSNGPKIVDVAQNLHMSERTLRRKLKQEGTSFRQLLDEVRGALAREYLQKTEINTADIATLVGYSDRANFNRAFSRWNWDSPSSYRNESS